MDITRLGPLILLLLFLGGFAIEGTTKTAHFNFLFDNGVSVSLQMNQQMLGQIQSNCRLDSMELKVNFEAFGLYLNEEVSTGSKAMNSKPHTIEEVSRQNVIDVLPSHLKQTLLDCLQKENIPFHVSGEVDGSKNWYIRHRESFLIGPDASRRCLGEKLLRGTTLAPTSASTSASDLVTESLKYAKEQPEDALRKHYFPPDTNSSKKRSAGKRSSSSKKNHSEVAVAVGVTAAATFVLSFVLFCCCRKTNKIHSENFEKDDRPLLAMSFRNFSFGSSRRPSLGGTYDKEKLGSLSSVTNPNQNGKFSSSNRSFSIVSDLSSLDKPSSLDESASAASSNIGASELPFPPLKPPPGRANPLPPGPPPIGSANPLPPGPPLTIGANPSPLGLPPTAKCNPSRDPSPTEKCNPSTDPPPSSRANPSPPGPPPPPSIPPGSRPGPPPPPPPTGSRPGPPPPPLPKVAGPPRPPQPLSRAPKAPTLRPKQSGNAAEDETPGEARSKLKPFFWDKVSATPDQSMVWHQIKAGSFQFDEEMIENLFGCTNINTNKNEHKKGFTSKEPPRQFIQIIDSKKAQNLSILLKALNVTVEEVQDALHKGNELPTELLQSLLKMAPTSEEELKLRLYTGDITLIGTAERFLKVLVDIPFAFKRMDLLLFKSSLREEVSGVKEALATLEIASKELRSSRLFLKLLEAVLKTGNRMNDGTFRGRAQAFKLDTLLKLADVKGTDGKITLLHFVVQEIIRSEGRRAARSVSEGNIPTVNTQDLVADFSQGAENYYRSLGLEVVSGLGAELENVRKAAGLDADSITGTVSKLGHGLVRTKNFLNSDMKSTDEDSEFRRMLETFVEQAEDEITWLLQEEKRIMSLVKSTVDYFHGSAGKDEGLRLFVIVRDFLLILDKVCKEVRKTTKLVPRVQRNRELPTIPHPDAKTCPSPDLRNRLCPAIADRRTDNSSSDEESP